MTAQKRVLLAMALVVVDLLVFALPLTALVVAYVIALRPRWFLQWVIRLYGEPANMG